MKNRILLAILVLFFSLIFCSSVFADLYIINDKEGKNVCITNINTLISKYRELGYELILVPASNLLLTFLPTLKEGEIKETEIKQDPEVDIQGDIKIIDWVSRIDGNYYYIEGILKNVGKSKVEYIQVKAIAYDSNKKLVTLKRGYSNPADLDPGKEADFKIMIKYNAKIKNFELKLDWKG